MTCSSLNVRGGAVTMATIRQNVIDNNKTRATRRRVPVQVEANLQEQLSDHLHVRKLKCS